MKNKVHESTMRYDDQHNNKIQPLFVKLRTQKLAYINLLENQSDIDDKATKAAAELSSIDHTIDDIINELNDQLLRTEDDIAFIVNSSNRSSEQLSNMATTSIWIISIVSLIGAVAFSIYIISDLMAQLGGDPAEVAAVVEQIGKGDLTVNLKHINGKQNVGLLRSVEVMVEKLKEIIGMVMTSSENIASASAQMSSSAQQLSQGATEQASTVEEISSSMEQMASRIQLNTDNARQTEKIAMKSSIEMKDGNQIVNQTVESMKKIADRVSIIGEIARQTNLLALNAAVEAARAGEHGRGFAVVAAEVRKLAERSQVSAREIDDLSKVTMTAADRSIKMLDMIVPNIDNTAKLVQEIAASSIEQNSGADQINNAIQQFNQVVQQNAASSEEIASSSEELASQAATLKETIAFFKVDDNLKKSIRLSQRAPKHVTHTNSSATHNSKEMRGVLIDLDKKDALDKGYERF